MLRRIEGGEDPQAERNEYRTTPMMENLAARYIEEHLPTKRLASAKDDRAMLEIYVVPAFRKLKVTDVDFGNVSKLHREITKAGTRYRAIGALALLSKMFFLAERWGMRPDNPCKSVKKNHEELRERYLAPAELERLMRALVDYPDAQAVNPIMPALLTGARRSEVFKAQWTQLDLTKGVGLNPQPTQRRSSVIKSHYRRRHWSFS